MVRNTLLVGIASLALVASCGGGGGDAGGANALPVTSHGLGNAAADPLWCPTADSHALELPGVGLDLAFLEGGQFLDRKDGSSALLAVVASRANPAHRWRLELELTDEITPSANDYATRANPELALLPGAYGDQGGPVDETRWSYFAGLTGTLTGLDACAGAVLDLRLEPGCLFQIGAGANGRNVRFGASARLEFDTTQQPSGGLVLPASGLGGRVSIDLEKEVVNGAGAPTADPRYTASVGDVALQLPGLGGDYVFRPAAQFVEHGNGRASLTGRAVSLADSDDQWLVHLNFDDRRDPRDGDALPAGSPRRDLSDDAYVENGGPVDVEHWRYYASVSGWLNGFEDNAGAKLRVSTDDFAFQVGRGASGCNVEHGAACSLGLAVTAQPDQGGAISTSRGELFIDLTGAVRSVALNADHDTGLSLIQAGGHAFWLPGIGEDFSFVTGGSFVEFPDGTASLTGIIARDSDSTQRFAVDVAFSGRISPRSPNHAPPGSPKKSLRASTYLGQGGIIPTRSWHYYWEFSGKLTGLETFEGAEISIVRAGPAFQVGMGASGMNAEYGASGWIDAEILSGPTVPFAEWPSSPFLAAADVNIDLTTESFACVEEAPEDVRYGSNGGHALWLPGIGTDFVMLAGGKIVELPDGTAQVTGVFARESNDQERWYGVIDLDGRVDAGDAGFPPAGSPKLQLAPSAYTDAGGVVDPDAWRYYTGTYGLLTGLGDYEGALLEITRRGEAFQIGVGANGKNVANGGSGWLDWQLLQAPTTGIVLPQTSGTGDLNLDFGECRDCVEGAEFDPRYASSPGSAAVWLPAIAEDLEFVSGPLFEQLPDGSARLTGEVASAADPSLGFVVDVHLAGRVDPGAPTYPPPGSPKTGMHPSAYQPAGPVDTGAWHYYTNTWGTLTGVGGFDGARIAITRFGPSFQVGLGANDRNLEFGASGWFNVDVLAQPDDGSIVFPTPAAHGDFNVELGECPPVAGQ